VNARPVWRSRKTRRSYSFGLSATAVRRHAGEAAFIQRCQVHKKRNVVDHLPDEHKAEVKRKMQNAYAMADYPDAKRALERLHRELMDLNPSAARSLEEGMEETLTVHRLRVPDQLRRSLSSTNVIESAFSIVETVCRNVKRWRDGDQIERWVGSGLLVAERQFRKVIGHRQIPLLLASIAGQTSWAATELAREHLGRPLPNVPLLGAFAALTGAITLSSVVTAIRGRFEGQVGEGNAAAARAAYELARSALEEPVHA